MARPKPEELSGIEDAARLFGVKIGTVHRWRTRGIMPEPIRIISGAPVWFTHDLVTWGFQTYRIEAPPPVRTPHPTRGAGLVTAQ